MKHTNRKILTVAVVMLLACMMVFAMPAAVYAETASTFPTGVSVNAMGVQIDLADGETEEKPVYELVVTASGQAFSAFQLSFRMPDFVEVVGVEAGARLLDMNNAEFTHYVEGDGRVNTIFSCSDNTDGSTLFIVRFTVKEYVESYCDVEYVASKFTNVEMESLETSVSLGYVQIGESDFGVMGDVDGNGNVNLADLLVIQRSIVNPTFTLTEEQFAVADINHDGNVDVFDCQYIQNYLVGRIDSLENIGGGNGGNEGSTAFYSIKITITDQNGEILFDGAREAKEGEAYESFMSPIFEQLSESYEITNLSIYTDVYGDVSIDSDGEGFVVKGNDAIKMVVNAVKKEKKVKYEFSATMPNSDGSETYMKYTFYTDGTAFGEQELIIDGKVMDREERTVEWKESDGYIDIIVPDSQIMAPMRLFVVNPDGTLSLYMGGDDGGDQGGGDQAPEYSISSSSIGIGYHGVVVGSDPQALIDQLCEHYYTATFDKIGTETIWITPELIDYSAVDFNTPGEYEVEIYITRYGNNVSMSVTVFVLADKSEVEVAGVYEFLDPMSEEMDINRITVYKDNTLMLDDYYQAEFVTYQENVIIFTLDGTELVLALDQTAKTACYYEPSKADLIGSYILSESGFSVFYEVYGQYTGAGLYVTVVRYSMGDMQMMITGRAYLDRENAWLLHESLPCRMTFDASGALSVDHLTEIETVAPTCTAQGQEIHRCTVCREVVFSQPIDKLDHQYDASGVCGSCGHSEKELEELERYKAQTLESMNSTWVDLSKQYGDLSDFAEQYDKYYNEVLRAGEIYIIHEYMGYFATMVNTIHDKHGNGGDMGVHPNGWYLEGEYPTSVTVGADIDEYIATHIIGKILVVELSDGQTLHIPVESYMIGGYSADFGTVGESCIYIHCAQGNFSIDHSVWVRVEPDMENAVGTVYSFAESRLSGWDIITVYDNGVVGVYDQYFVYSVHSDSEALTVIRFNGPNFYGESVVTLNHQTMTANFYQPTEGVIGCYTLYEGDNEYIYTVYGTYSGAGNYVAFVQRKLGDGTGEYKQEDYYTTTVHCDLERSMISDALYGPMTFDSDKVLSFGVPDGPAEDTFEEYQDQIKDEIKVLWEEIDQGGYDVTQEQRDQMYEILDRVYQMSEYWELEQLREEAQQLYNEITGGCEIEWYSCSGIPRRVVVGTTMEEFLEMLGGATLILHYSDSTEETVMLTIDMMNFMKIDLNTEGTWDLYWTYQMDDRTLEGTTQVQVIENMVENASPKGVYAFLPHREGATDVMMDMLYIKLYDNSYAMLYDVDGVRFVEYTQSGNIVSYTYNGMLFVYEIALDADGDPVGISPYRAETEQIYTIETEDEYVTLEVFAYGDGYLGFFTLVEMNTDGSEDVGEGTCEIFFNEDGTALFAGPLEGWYAICADGSLVPCECEHQYDESGYCEYCGSSSNSSGSDLPTINQTESNKINFVNP